jgi:1,4-alpha-glucan branching enzyme
MNSSQVIIHSLLTEFDISLYKVGKHYHMYEKMGAHPMDLDGVAGCYFCVYAPNAEEVAVVGDFNNWDGENHMLYSRWDGSGIWEGFIAHLKIEMVYKYLIIPRNNGRVRLKTDPFGFKSEHPPLTGSIISHIDGYQWHDKQWMDSRINTNSLDQPISIYEVHLGSWRRKKGESGRSYTYHELADELVGYVSDMGYTHVEFLPIAEFPYEPSWGYQVTGYYAASSRYGEAKDLMYLIDSFHQANIGVIIDWVPAHFPADDHALATFDGSCVFEHPDRRKGYHPDWNTLIFNFGRPEVKSFLISNAFFWLEKFHIDGLRVDAVSSIVYLDYSRKDGEWEPNQYGGRENLDAISFLQEFNTAVYGSFPGVQTIAEESTAYPMVSRPIFQGGLGFGMKWMMGWMHDTIDYFKREFIYRKFHQNDITFSIVYAFSENFMLALSHDEVVHGKASMIGKMSGDEWQKFANLRTLYAYMFMHPGAKLLFMGNDIAPYKEWNFTWELEWDLLQYPSHKGINDLVRDLNHLYKKEKSLHHYNFDYRGFEWIDAGDRNNSILVFSRKSNVKGDHLLVICNLNVHTHLDYKIGLSQKTSYDLIFNTDDSKYWGSNHDIVLNVSTIKKAWNGKPHTLSIIVPPLSVVVYKAKPILSRSKLQNVKSETNSAKSVKNKK